MRQKFCVRGEFLLPEGFSGGFIEAMQLYVEHCKETWDNQPRLPSTLPDEFCFPYLVSKGGESYTTFAIESFRYESLDESLEIESEREEEEIESICTESSQ
jgi:hypothetical protein